jgi:hypothetical protein
VDSWLLNQGLVVQSTYPGGNSFVLIQAYPGNPATFYMGTINSARWLLYTENSGETGGNAGSNFNIVALQDDGSWLSHVMWFRRNDQAISMVGPAFCNRSLTVAGDAVFNGGTTTVNGALNVGGNMGVNNIWVNGSLFGRPDSWIYIGSNVKLVNDIQVDGTINCSHNANMAGDVHCNAVFGPNGLYAGGDTDMGLWRGSSTRIMQFAARWYWQWQNNDGTAGFVRDGTYFWVMRAADNLCYNQLGPVGGYGGYANFSDRRSKVNVAASQRGLDAIMQLQPVEFTRIHATPDKWSTKASPRRELGFVAQDVMGVIPEAVTKFGYTLADGSGGLDSADPSLALDTDAIIATMVNAIKTLAGRVASLEARRGA